MRIFVGKLEQKLTCTELTFCLRGFDPGEQGGFQASGWSYLVNG